MKRADISVGESYRGTSRYPLYGSRIKVLEIGVERPYRGQRKPDGIRVEVERVASGSYLAKGAGETAVFTSRDIEAPWIDADDRALDEKEDHTRRRKALQARVRDLDGFTVDFSGRLIVFSIARAEELLDKAGL